MHAATAQQLDHAAVRAAAERIAGGVRPVTVAPAAEAGVWYALEYLQHTGSFKARGARNFLAAHHEAGALPAAGVTIASGGNAGLACAWASRALAVPATVFLPARAPRVKVERLRGYGADVRLVGDRYADALAACEEFAAESGALSSHAYDHPLIAAGAGTLLEEIRAALPGLDTVVVAVEPENCRALNAALAAGRVVDVAVESVAADSLGATRVSADALAAAQQENVTSVLVSDTEITAARRALWEEHRIVVEAGAATALAALRGAAQPLGDRVAVILCGANTDPRDLAEGAEQSRTAAV
ncbi:pyridoxal-phosphate dependent enzyme [Streptomyces sp. NPDC056402]|uniref:pyridoxal-phosphate dependent enzyme n=1 Tax=Streptomyces sp. NPDC056402 TaxID=3345810 RepID=UPI0035E0BA3D